MSFIVKSTTLPGLFDLVSPHSCRGCGCLGVVLCECCKNDILKHQQIHPPIYAVGEKNGVLETLIHDFKYCSVRDLAKPLAELIDRTLPKDLPQNSIIVPLPTATRHVRARGLDHTYLIGKHLAKMRHFTLKRAILRDKNTVQVGSDRATRIAQASSAYTINSHIKINPNATYILLDDVWTTGASIKAAEKILKDAGAQNIIVALLTYSSY